MTKNIAASIRQRLLNKAKAEKRPFNELLQYYAMERFLYRLSLSKHADQFILKGALMLRVWQAPEARPTMDIDMLGKTNNAPEAITEQIQEILAADVPDDGMLYNPDTISTEIIKEDADYQGVRIRLQGSLGSAQIKLQLDIGFGDALVPGAARQNFPVLLDQPVPELLCYSRESAIAEKFEAMVKLGELNSRMKDFYDIWLLSRQFTFEGQLLGEAITQTFARRETALPSRLPFSEDFIALKQKQWAAFCKRLNAENTPSQFATVCDCLTEFLGIFAVRQDGGWHANNAPINRYAWQASGPWQAVQEQ